MTHTLALMQREWLQHRFAWTLMAVLPTVLVVLLLTFGEVHLAPEETGPHLPLALAFAALAAGMGLQALILWIVALIVTAGLARRDHGDRSIEFWLSLPTGHAESLAVPLLVHLLLAPLAALAVGLAGGAIASFVLVSRVDGAGSWFSLPWGTVAAAVLALGARLGLGMVLVTLWLAPVLMLMVLLTAALGRWGLAILALGGGLGVVVLDQAFGIPWPAQWVSYVAGQAGRALLNADSSSAVLVVESSGDLAATVAQLPAWALADAMKALSLSATPGMLAGLAAAAACFAVLVQWRRRGAQHGG